MKKNFTFKTQDNSLECEAYWNEKTYSNGLRYVTVSHGYQSARGTYNANTGRWEKSVGNEAYNNAIAQALGWK